METQPVISVETVVALAVGIPALLVALVALWIGYITFRDSHERRRRGDLELQASPSAAMYSMTAWVPAAGDNVPGMPARPNPAKTR